MPEAANLLLAFDFGLRRIGVATGNGLTRTASPLTTIQVTDPFPWNQIEKLIADWRPDLIVVGHPGDGANPELLTALDEFLTALGARFPVPVVTVDESHTSSAAEEELRTYRRQGVYNRRLNRGQIDRQAACLIAEQWMNQQLG